LAGRHFKEGTSEGQPTYLLEGKNLTPVVKTGRSGWTKVGPFLKKRENTHASVGGGGKMSPTAGRRKLEGKRSSECGPNKKKVLKQGE